eukprot:706327-Rhodomonas_salina.1
MAKSPQKKLSLLLNLDMMRRQKNLTSSSPPEKLGTTSSSPPEKLGHPPLHLRSSVLNIGTIQQ